MWDQTLRDWASTNPSESEPTDSHTRSRGAYLHLGRQRHPLHPTLAQSAGLLNQDQKYIEPSRLPSDRKVRP